MPQLWVPQLINFIKEEDEDEANETFKNHSYNDQKTSLSVLSTEDIFPLPPLGPVLSLNKIFEWKNNKTSKFN